MGPKLGITKESTIPCTSASPRIWVHAVSVGEVTAAAPIVRSLRELFPAGAIFLSTSTETGQKLARSIIKDATEIIYYPLDYPFVVKKVLERVSPDIFVPVETELWPNFIRCYKNRGVKVVLVNGRISPRSYRGYRMTRFFWRPILRSLDGICAISDLDRSRLVDMGARKAEIEVYGNAKYDGFASQALPAYAKEARTKLGLSSNSRVFVAASTHEGEEDAVLRAYGRLLSSYPDLILILVPRHIERREAVLRLLEKWRSHGVVTLTDLAQGRERSGEKIILIDVIGELFKIYSVANVVFCGGSLVPRGGQNILEPAAWGKVVLYGPSMDDFTSERDGLENAGAGITVPDGDALAGEIDRLLKNPGLLAELGGRGRKVVERNRGASERYAKYVASKLATGTLTDGGH